MAQESNQFDEELSNGEGGEESNQAHSNGNQEGDESEEFMSENDENGAEDAAGEEEEVVEEAEAEEDAPKKEATAKTRSKPNVITTRYLWVNNVAPQTRPNHLEELFEKYAKVLAVKIIRGAGSSLLAFVKLENVEQAQKCFSKLNNVEFRGQTITLAKDRPDTGENREKIGLRSETRPGYRPYPSTRPSYRSSGGGRPSSFHRHESSRDHRDYRHHSHERDHGGGRYNDFRSRGEREEILRLEREKEKLKIERLKLERDRLELLKLKTYGDRSRAPDEKRRPMDGLYLEEKARGGYSDFSRRDDFGGRKLETDRKGYPSRTVFPSNIRTGGSGGGRYEDNGRALADRYESSAYRSQVPVSGGWQSSTADRWQSSSYEPSGSSAMAPRLMSNTIGSVSRLHSSADLGGQRNPYFSSTSRRY